MLDVSSFILSNNLVQLPVDTARFIPHKYAGQKDIAAGLIK